MTGHEGTTPLWGRPCIKRPNLPGAAAPSATSLSQALHTLSTPHHHQVMELSETNHNTMTGYTNMARVALNFGGGGKKGAVQRMDLQLSPTTTITIFLTKHPHERVRGTVACL